MGKTRIAGLALCSLALTLILYPDASALTSQEHSILFGISDNEPSLFEWFIQVFVSLFKYVISPRSTSILGKIFASTILIWIPTTYALIIIQLLFKKTLPIFMSLILPICPLLGGAWIFFLLGSMFVPPSNELFHIPNYVSYSLSNFDGTNSLIEVFSLAFFAWLLIPLSLYAALPLSIFFIGGETNKLKKTKVKKTKVKKEVSPGQPFALNELYGNLSAINEKIFRSFFPTYWHYKPDEKDEE